MRRNKPHHRVMGAPILMHAQAAFLNARIAFLSARTASFFVLVALVAAPSPVCAQSDLIVQITGTPVAPPPGKPNPSCSNSLHIEGPSAINVGDQVDFSVTGGVPTYQWTAGSQVLASGSTVHARGVAPGQTTLWVLDGQGCSGSLTITVECRSVEISGPSVLPLGQSAHFDAAGGRGPYSWSPDESGRLVPSVIGSAGADYLAAQIGRGFVTVTDRDGCPGQFEVLVTCPEMTIGGPAVLTVGQGGMLTAVGAAGPVTWQMAPGPGLPALAVDGRTGAITALMSGVATVVATDSANPGCSAEMNVAVSNCPPGVVQIILPPISGLPGIPSIEVGDELTVSASPSSQTYRWISSNPAAATIDPATGVVTGQAAGVTRIIAMDGAGCAQAALGVNPAECKTTVGIRLGPKQTSGPLNVGGTLQLQGYTRAPGQLPDATGPFTWAVTAGGNFASVDQNGKVTAKAVGTATVTVTLKGSPKCKASYPVTICDPPSDPGKVSADLECDPNLTEYPFGKITVDWTYDSTEQKGRGAVFVVSRRCVPAGTTPASDDDPAWTVVATLRKGETEFTQPAQKELQDCYYRVQARAKDGCSSDWVATGAVETPPGGPGDLNISRTVSSKVVVGKDPVTQKPVKELVYSNPRNTLTFAPGSASKDVSYDIEYREISGGKAGPWKPDPGADKQPTRLRSGRLSWTDTELNLGDSYEYRITAVYRAGTKDERRSCGTVEGCQLEIPDASAFRTTQQTAMWCWAASLVMMMKAAGYNPPANIQAELSKILTGQQQALVVGATCDQILAVYEKARTQLANQKPPVVLPPLSALPNFAGSTPSRKDFPSDVAYMAALTKWWQDLNTQSGGNQKMPPRLPGESTKNYLKRLQVLAQEQSALGLATPALEAAIRAGMPFLIGFQFNLQSGHVVVVIGLTCHYILGANERRTMVIDQLEYLDPWDGQIKAKSGDDARRTVMCLMMLPTPNAR